LLAQASLKAVFLPDRVYLQRMKLFELRKNSENKGKVYSKED